MKQFGLQEKELAKPSLYVDSISERFKLEIENATNIDSSDFIFIPNNYKRAFGNELDSSIPNLESHMNIIEEHIEEPKPSKAEAPIKSTRKQITKPNYVSARQRKNLTTIIRKQEESVSPINIKITNSLPILVAVQTTPKYILAALPLIKLLRHRGFNIDIYENDKLNIVNNLFPSDLINHKFDITDISSGLILYKKYYRIIKTIGCNINIPADIPFINCNSISDSSDIVSKNIYAFTNITNEEVESSKILPTCAFTVPKKKLPDNTISICVSNMKNSAYTWKELERLIPTIAMKYGNRTILLYSLFGENKLIPNHMFKDLHNVVDIDRLSITEAAGYIRYSQLSMSGSDSQAFWLSYALKSQSLIFGPNSNELPQVSWMSFLDSIDESNFENILENICEKM
jgi:hypothetical protein